ncbi:MAG: tryptophan synthase subunit alpha [Cellvibrionaceae bacterium]
MTRIANCFEKLKKENKKALVTYVVNGDPTSTAILPTMYKLVENGADIIELGVPFSDPMAEGPVIQLGHERALANGASLRSSIAVVKKFRETNQTTPVVLMGYENPIERMGYEAFAESASDAGVDGLISVDLPPEEATELNSLLKKVGVDNIFLLSPSTTLERAKHIISLATGFLYYVSLKGVTGAGHIDIDAVNQRLAEFRTLTELPLCVGFGIKDGATAKAVTQSADGAVIGSLLVDKMGSMAGSSDDNIAKAIGELVLPFRQTMDS